MIDSHALVGSCAQIGKRVHLSAGAQIGGVLEPIGELPVIIEDDVLVGGNCGVYEGAIVRERAVLASGTILTGGTPVYDLVNDEFYRKTAESPLEIPAGAVVVAGSRAIRPGPEFGHDLYADHRDIGLKRCLRENSYLRCGACRRSPWPLPGREPRRSSRNSSRAAKGRPTSSKMFHQRTTCHIGKARPECFTTARRPVR
jgi:hypothetical protein